MTTPSDKFISIKLEIQIPADGTGQLPVAAPLVTVTEGAQKRPRRVMATIERPAGGPENCRHTSGQGFVCACGTAIDGNIIATEGKVKVFLGNPGTAPDMGGAIPIDINQSTGEWGELEVPGVTGYPLVAEHRLVKWLKWPNGSTSFVISNPFTPLWSATACDPDRVRPPVVASAAPRIAFGPLPRAWRLCVRLFQGDIASKFNGDWTLALTRSLQEGVVYCNGGDGSGTPRVQLTAEPPLSAWQLTFELNGSRVVYELPSATLDGQTQNVFQNPRTVALGESDSLPASVVLVPH